MNELPFVILSLLRLGLGRTCAAVEPSTHTRPCRWPTGSVLLGSGVSQQKASDITDEQEEVRLHLPQRLARHRGQVAPPRWAGAAGFSWCKGLSQWGKARAGMGPPKGHGQPYGWAVPTPRTISQGASQGPRREACSDTRGSDLKPQVAGQARRAVPSSQRQARHKSARRGRAVFLQIPFLQD